MFSSRDPDDRFGHEHVDEIVEGQPGSATRRKRFESVLDHVDIAPARIHPLSDIAEQATRHSLHARPSAPEAVPIFIEPRHSASDSAKTEIFAKSVQQFGCAAVTMRVIAYQIVVRCGRVGSDYLGELSS